MHFSDIYGPYCNWLWLSAPTPVCTCIPPTALHCGHATRVKAHIQRKFLNYYKTSSQTHGNINANASHQSNLCHEYLVGSWASVLNIYRQQQERPRTPMTRRGQLKAHLLQSPTCSSIIDEPSDLRPPTHAPHLWALLTKWKHSAKIFGCCYVLASISR